MENVSKALLMAGGIMLTMLIVSILLYSITVYSENQEERERLKATEELTKFNLQFTNYARDDVLGYEIMSLINKVIDYNQRFSKEGEATGSVAGNYFQYTPITLKISFESDGGKHDELYSQLRTRTIVNRPAVAKTGHENEIYDTSKNNSSKFYPTESNNKYEHTDFLFKETDTINKQYIQSNTVHKLQSILNRKDVIEMEYTKDGAQTLSKSIGSIFEGKIIDYNGRPTEDTNEKKLWYEKSYIESRFKSLTNNNKTIDKIREDDTLNDILQYNEFMQFKKASFECYNLQYDSTSNRVSLMEFRYTGDDLE